MQQRMARILAIMMMLIDSQHSMESALGTLDKKVVFCYCEIRVLFPTSRGTRYNNMC
jgi:hypothetical protein